MSLLDDVSIVVTPNGYKAGELYAVIPVPSEGAEEVVNGDFATDSAWTKSPSGVTISGGSANFNLASDTYIYQDILTEGKTYKITFSGTINSGSFYIGQIGVFNNVFSAGTYTDEVVYLSVSNLLGGYRFIIRKFGAGTLDATIDNVSVKEYTSADMDVTRATAATRVDENGLVNYAEILGGELTSPLNFLSTWLETSVDSKTYNTFTVGGSGRGMYFMLPENKTLKINVSGVTGSVELRYRTTTGGAGTVLGDFDTDLYLTTTNATTNIYLRATGAGTVSVTDVSVKEVTRDNVPRIDYTGGGCPHILAEPQRTNLLPYSEAFNSWNTKQNVTVAEDTSETTSPSGNNTASKITINSSGTPRRLYEIVTTSSGSDYTFTLYAKKGTTDYIRILFSSVIIDVAFNLTSGTVTSGAGSIEAVGNDWYRIQATGTSSSASEVPQIQLSSSASVSDYLYIYGCQIEEGSYATSYIPTDGSTVTRVQDQYSKTGISNLINSEEGVLFLEMAALSDDLTYREISLSDGTSTNRIEIRYTTNSNRIQVLIRNGSYLALQYDVSSIVDFNKVAFKWKTGDFALWVNGVERATDSTTFVTSGLNRLAFDQSTSGNEFFGKVKQLQVYDTALTDTQLAALTS